MMLLSTCLAPVLPVSHGYAYAGFTTCDGLPITWPDDIDCAAPNPHAIAPHRVHPPCDIDAGGHLYYASADDTLADALWCGSSDGTSYGVAYSGVRCDR